MRETRRPVLRSLVDRIFDTKAFYYSFKRARRREAVGRHPLRARLGLGLRGFFPDKKNLYAFDQHSPDQFFSDWQIIRSSHIDRQYGIVIDDKVLFALVMQPYIRVPRNFALVTRGELIWLDRAPHQPGDLLSLLQDQGRLIIKPVRGIGGRGVRLLEHKEGRYLHRGEEIDASGVEQIVRGAERCVVSEHIQQGSYARALYPHSVNTVRIATMVDPETGVPFVGFAHQRIGTAHTAPVDNAHAGGLSCGVDVETGRLDRASWLLGPNPAEQLEHHPETGVRFEDQVVPNWHAICDELVEVARRFPMIPLVAWDIAILDDGIAAIEANSWSGATSTQRDRPILSDPRVRAFLRAHGIA